MPIRSTYKTSYFTNADTLVFTPLFSMVYVSASTHLLSDAELGEILTVSRENNAEIGITGMLLYYEGAFMQVLEGTEELVRSTYMRISLDPRHHLIMPLLEEYIPERNFPNWSMGYYRLGADEAKHLDGFVTFSEAGQFLAYFQESPQKSLALLQSFSQRSLR